MDMNRMTIKLQEALQSASSHAMRRSHQGMDVEHLLLALLEQDLLEQRLDMTGAQTWLINNLKYTTADNPVTDEKPIHIEMGFRGLHHTTNTNLQVTRSSGTSASGLTFET